MNAGPLILSIETATDVCSVCVAQGMHVLAFRETTEGRAHASKITVFAEEVMRQAEKKFTDLDAVAVSMGPGSYTGLRIGVSAAKGLCFALDIPLIAIPTLQAMATGMRKMLDDADTEITLLCPAIDARRMEVYSSVFDLSCREIRETRAEIIDGNSFGEYLSESVVVFAGSGSEKIKGLLHHHPHAKFLHSFQPSAINMVTLAENKFGAAAFEDTAYFEPRYLKEFVATPPKKP
jgi:tRNA threonylcarbamoyladenosine biosynthesis protein TsaB